MVHADRADCSNLAKKNKGSGRNPWINRWWIFLPLLCVLLASCGELRPKVLPQMATLPSAGLADRCRAFFPQGHWQLTHTIHFQLADGTNGNALGVLTIAGSTLNCALLSIEGLTLFEASSAQDGALEVLRALPPFDSPAFAAGLIADIRTLFFMPLGVASTGRLVQGEPLCRYTDQERVTDILPDAAGCFQLSTYALRPKADGALPVLTRSVNARSCIERDNSRLAQNLTLTGLGRAGYTLNLRLLTAEPLPAARP
jgi:hypothetical protein